MKLQDLSNEELGKIVRDGPLWPILLEFEKESKKIDSHQACKSLQ